MGVTAAGDNLTSTAGSDPFTPTATGYWCFAADYSGDSNYGISSDSSTDECFDVTAQPTSTTSAPTSTTIVLGASNSDGATVDGNSTSGSPTGTVSFYECGPTLAPAACASTAHPVGGAVGVAAGANDTSTAGSASFTPISTGYWCFAAVYSGDSNYGTSSDASTDECFDVTAASTSTTTRPTSTTVALGAAVHDGATVTGNAAGGSPTGTVSLLRVRPDRLGHPVHLHRQSGR